MKKITLQDVLEIIEQFADTDPEQIDWQLISDIVEQYLDCRELNFMLADYLPEEDEFQAYVADDDRY